MRVAGLPSDAHNHDGAPFMATAAVACPLVPRASYPRSLAHSLVLLGRVCPLTRGVKESPLVEIKVAKADALAPSARSNCKLEVVGAENLVRQARVDCC